jgi:L-2-amino-thiazoline-4-carboxylic acid hydrolase
MNDSIRTKVVLNNFNRVSQAVRMQLLDYYPSKLVWGIFDDTRKELGFLVPKVPYIGEKNIWQDKLDNCVMNLALYRVLKKWKFDVDEAIQVHSYVFDGYLYKVPRRLHWAYHGYHFSQFHQKRLSAAAAQSQKRQYPGDWVFTYLDGNNGTFYFGIDVTECAILKLCLSYRVDEAYMLHLCSQDRAMSKILCQGFVQNGTLVEGAPVCDCRWKRGTATAM